MDNLSTRDGSLGVLSLGSIPEADRLVRSILHSILNYTVKIP